MFLNIFVSSGSLRRPLPKKGIWHERWLICRGDDGKAEPREGEARRNRILDREIASKQSLALRPRESGRIRQNPSEIHPSRSPPGILVQDYIRRKKEKEQGSDVQLRALTVRLKTLD